MNAISLQSTVFNGAAVLGPALAGIAIGLLGSAGHLIGLMGSFTGYAGNFFLNGISYFGVLFVLYFIRVPQEAVEQGTERRGPMLDSIRAALGAVRRDPALPWVLSGYGALHFFGPSNTLILPIFATQILHLNPFQLGLLFSAVGLGTLGGALIVASPVISSIKAHCSWCRFSSGRVRWSSLLSAGLSGSPFWLCSCLASRKMVWGLPLLPWPNCVLLHR
jgi:hypothetical protein